MRKKVILIVALAVLVVLGAVFAVLNIHAPGKLSMWQKKEIEYFYKKNLHSEMRTWYDDGNKGGPRYYGSENGYIIIFVEGIFQVSHVETIGNYRFRHSCTFSLLAYKNGQFYTLKEVYAQGLISKKTIEEAWETHKACEQEIKASGPR